jgi:sugar-specific transcriptional regulator TrmB
MSENSLKIRRKFLNKLGTKIDDLNENFILLSHVDKKIFKKMADQRVEMFTKQRGGMFTKQRGGTLSEAKQAALEILKVKKELKKQEDEVTKTYKKIEQFESTIESYKKSFENMIRLIKNTRMNVPPEPAITSYNFDSFNQEELDELELLMMDDKNLDLKVFRESASQSLKETFKDLDTFKQLMGDSAKDTTPQQEEALGSPRSDDEEAAIGGPEAVTPRSPD